MWTSFCFARCTNIANKKLEIMKKFGKFASAGLEETVEFIIIFQMDRGKTASAARNWTKSAPQTEATTFVFAILSILLLWLLAWH